MANEQNFIAQVDEWARAEESRLLAIFRESSQRVTSAASVGGNGSPGVPVDTGFARASVQASLTAMPPIDPGKTNKAKIPTAFNFGEISTVIANATLDQHIYIGWTAAYVNVLEYGHSKQAPNGFVRLAAAQWDQIVSEVSAEAKARSQVQ